MLDQHKLAIITALKNMPTAEYASLGWEHLGLWFGDIITSHNMTTEEAGKAITSLIKDGLVEVVFIDIELGIRLTP